MLQPEALKSILYPVGLTVPWRLAAAIVFWVFINSVLEEYVFRWFITSKIEQFVSGKWRAVFLSSAIFTLHHSIALIFFLDPLGAVIASLGVFIGGSIFSWLYIESSPALCTFPLLFFLLHRDEEEKKTAQEGRDATHHPTMRMQITEDVRIFDAQIKECAGTQI